MRHRARFVSSLVNNFALLAFAMLVLLPVAIVALGILQHRSLNADEWWVVLVVFGGAVVLMTPLCTISELTNWFEVTSDGLTCRTSSGVGAASLVMKKTHQLVWDDIVEVQASKYMPYRQITLFVNSQRKGRRIPVRICLPLYVRRPSDLGRDMLTHVPEENPLRQYAPPT